MKLMLIDDDNAAHTYHRIMIEGAGINLSDVESFYDVESAINSLEKNINQGETDGWPDYIFVDLNMPIKSGYDFVSAYELLNKPLKESIIYFVSSTKNPADIQKVNNIKLVKGFETKFLEMEFFKNLRQNN